MRIDWTYLLPALALLLTPISLFHGGKVRIRSTSRDWDTHWRQILTLYLHPLDLARAALGGWLLLNAIALLPGAHGPTRYAVMLTQGTSMIVGTLLQTVTCKEEDSAHAPFVFIAGLLLGFYPPAIAGLALLLALTLAGGARTPVAFFPVLAVALAGLGFGLGGKKILLQLVGGVGAALVPWLWSMLFHRDLLISYRAKRPGEII